MRIEEFDGDAAAAAELLRACAGIPRWVSAVVDARPFGTVDALVAAAVAAAAGWTTQEVERAIADHPRIGERPSGDGAAAAAARREQASAAAAPEGVAAAIRAGNAAYEQRFDRVFLVRAAGRTGAQILAELERRLANDAATETAETASALLEIAVLRLRGAFVPDAASAAAATPAAAPETVAVAR